MAGDSHSCASRMRRQSRVPGGAVAPHFAGLPGTKPEQFQKVASGADEPPFLVHYLQPPPQELPESPTLLDLTKHRLHSLHPQEVALPPRFRPQLPPCRVPGGQARGLCGPGAPVARPTLLGLVRRHQESNARSVEFAHSPGRVVAGVGGNFLRDCADMADDVPIMATACCLCEARVVARAAMITCWTLSTTTWQLYPCWKKSCHAGPGTMREVWVVEVALRLIIGNPRMSPAFGISIQRRRGLSYLAQPALPEGQLFRQSISLILAVPAVFLLIHLLRACLSNSATPPPTAHPCCSSAVDHGLLPRDVSPHLGAVQGHVAQLHQRGFPV